VRGLDYVEAARVLGAMDLRIMLRHVLPNIMAPLIVQTSLSVAFAILAEASLSFLGFGVKPPEPSWGSMVSLGRGYLQQAPWIVFGPGVAIFVTVMGFNFVGDALRDALDPRLSRRFAGKE
jgi:peptide/nickel transport system permease protein